MGKKIKKQLSNVEMLERMVKVLKDKEPVINNRELFEKALNSSIKKPHVPKQG
ncbi:MAG: hypothetical protein U0T77_00190 [Chitinophagales bacterium]